MSVELPPPPVSFPWLARHRGLALAIAAVLVAACGWSTIEYLRRQPSYGWSGMEIEKARFGGAVDSARVRAGHPVWGKGFARIGRLVPNGPADRAGIRTRDRVLAIDGVPLQDSIGLLALAQRSRPGETLVYRLWRDSLEATARVNLSRPGFPLRGKLRVALAGLVGVLFFLTGAFVYWRRPADRISWVFFLLAIGSACQLLLSSRLESVRPLQGITPTLPFMSNLTGWIYAWTALAVLNLSLLLHLALIFPRRSSLLDRHPYLVGWIYCAPLTGVMVFLAADSVSRPLRPVVAVMAGIVALFALIVFLATRRVVPWRTHLVRRPFNVTLAAAALQVALLQTALLVPRTWFGVRIFTVVLGAMLIMLGAAAVLLATWVSTVVVFVTRYRESSLEERQQIRWPLFATVTSLVGVALLTVLSLSVSLSPDRQLADLGWFLDALRLPLILLVPVGFAVGILKYRLLDLDLVIRKTAVYAVVTTIMLLLYVAIVGGVGGLIVQSLGVQSHWVTAFGTLAVALVFGPARDRVQKAIDRRFYRTRYEAADSLARLGNVLAAAETREQLARATGEELQRTLRARSLAVLVTNPQGRTMRTLAHLGLTDERARALEGISERELLSQLPSAPSITAVSWPPPLLQAARMARARVVVPVRGWRDAFGLILVGAKLSDEEFDEADLDYLAAAAGQLGAALANLDPPARREIADAMEIQAGLLPRTLPTFAGLRIAAHWQPARHVAGDYYDVLRLDDGRAALCIGDVTGKGMPAALLMSNLQATSRTYAAAGLTPSAFCRRVNDVMGSVVSPGRFITFFYGVVDPVRRTLLYTNAGHNPPVLMRADGRYETLDVGGVLLGCFPDVSFEQAEVALESGDHLLLYTDGLTEAMDVGGELFGEERVLEVMRRSRDGDPRRLQNAVIEAAAEFCGHEFDDDATVMVVVVD